MTDEEEDEAKVREQARENALRELQGCEAFVLIATRPPLPNGGHETGVVSFVPRQFLGPILHCMSPTEIFQVSQGLIDKILDVYKQNIARTELRDMNTGVVEESRENPYRREGIKCDPTWN